MTAYRFSHSGEVLEAAPSGALWAPERRLLAVADLHLGKAERIARLEAGLTPPYETRETLARLGDLVAMYRPATVVLLGDSFDDDRAAEALPEDVAQDLTRLMAGRRWIWIAGNHDPAPTRFGGAHRAEHCEGPLTFRHIAMPGAAGEISGHYHPKVTFRGRRPAFLVDASRVILPAFGAYAGGLDVTDPAFDPLMAEDALALMTGRRISPAPRKVLLARARGGQPRNRPASVSAGR